MNFVRVMPGRVAYRIPVNSLDSMWEWACCDCGYRRKEWEKTAIEKLVTEHRCRK